MKIYPENIIKYADDIINIFKENPESEKDFDFNVLKTEICDIALKKFLANRDDIRLNEYEIHDCVRMSMFYKAAKTLKEKGILDYIEDDNGEDVFFLTKEGKEIAKKMFNE